MHYLYLWFIQSRWSFTRRKLGTYLITKGIANYGSTSPVEPWQLTGFFWRALSTTRRTLQNLRLTVIVWWWAWVVIVVRSGHWNQLDSCWDLRYTYYLCTRRSIAPDYTLPVTPIASYCRLPWRRDRSINWKVKLQSICLVKCFVCLPWLWDSITRCGAQAALPFVYSSEYDPRLHPTGGASCKLPPSSLKAWQIDQLKSKTLTLVIYLYG